MPRVSAGTGSTYDDVGKLAAPHISALATWVVEDCDGEGCGSAAMLVAKFDCELVARFARLVAARLTDDDPSVRYSAVATLGELGEHGAPYYSAIAAVEGDDDVMVSEEIQNALAQLGEHRRKYNRGLWRKVSTLHRTVAFWQHVTSMPGSSAAKRAGDRFEELR